MSDAGEEKAKTISIYENQRFYPVIGWSKKLLPTDPKRLASWLTSALIHHHIANICMRISIDGLI
jgi:hypothetical protein